MDNFGLELPKSWEDLTVDEFKELIQIDSEEFENNFMKSIAILCTILRVDDSYFEELDIFEIEELFNSIRFLKESPTTNFAKVIGKYNFKQLEKLLLGEFIDIEYFMADGIYKNIDIIASILYRQNKTGEWGELVVEPYDSVDIYKRSDEIKDIPITKVFGVINHFINWRENFMKQYSSNFIEEVKDGDSDEEMSLADLKEEEVEKKLRKLNWPLLIDKLTKGDITKTNDVLNLPLIQVMNYLVTLRAKDLLNSKR